MREILVMKPSQIIGLDLRTKVELQVDKQKSINTVGGPCVHIVLVTPALAVDSLWQAIWYMATNMAKQYREMGFVDPTWNATIHN